jgi:hypothetical protein
MLGICRLVGRVLPVVLLLSLPFAFPTPASTQTTSSVLVGAGDIADCNSAGDEATAALLDGINGTVFTTGDNVYETGTATEFANCYNPSWGRHKARTRPSVGNHEYGTAGATGYFGYFGSAAGEQGKGYYSYDLGAWHIVVLNSNCAQVGGCQAGSVQEQWLRADLAAHPAACTLAYWHHPRFSSGQHGNNSAMQPFWQALYDFGADVVLNGHDHTYERFAPQTPSGASDPQRGIRQFVVGTGGRSHYGFPNSPPNSEVRNGNTFGVLKLTLSSNTYNWQFVPVAGGTFTDSGTGTCVTASSAMPAAPTGLTVSSRGKNSLVLAWTDNANNESGFKIERRTGSGGYAQVATVGPNVRKYTDGGLAARTNYTYRVRAYNAGGNSGYSNEASGTTK